MARPKRTANPIDTPAKRAKLPHRPAPYFHRLAPGEALGYRTTSGQWIARLHNSGQPRKHRVLGHESKLSYGEAAKLAGEWFKHGGEAPETLPSKLTLQLVCSAYLSYRYDKTEFEGYKSTKSLFDNYVLGHPIHKRPVASLTTLDYQKWLDETGQRILGKHKHPDEKERERLAHYTANMTWHWLEAALNRAAKTNPNLDKTQWRNVEPLKKGKSKSRPVFLSPKECQRLVNATSGPLRDLILGGIYTGARVGELKAMRVGDLDLNDGIWTPSHSKTENGTRDRFLDEQTVALLKRLTAGKSSEDLVFTHADGEPWRSRYDRPFREAVARAKLPKGTCFYSLRHSYISRQVANGVQPLFIAENCGTSVKEIERSYAKFKPSQKRELLAKGAIEIEVPESNIVAL